MKKHWFHYLKIHLKIDSGMNRLGFKLSKNLASLLRFAFFTVIGEGVEGYSSAVVLF